MNPSITAQIEQIVQHLDTAYGSRFSQHDFPMLEGGYVDVGLSRLTLYAQEKEWAIVLEAVGYDSIDRSIQLEVTYLGNNILTLYPDSNSNTFSLLDEEDFLEEEEDDLEEDDFDLISKEIEEVVINEHTFPVEHKVASYEALGIPLECPEQGIDAVAFMLYLVEHYPQYFRANILQKRAVLSPDLVEIITIDEWHHRDYYTSEPDSKPSAYETFPLLAKVLATADPSHWQPTLKANNHWSNWLDSGNL